MIVSDLINFNNEELQEVVILSKHIPTETKPLFNVKSFINLKYKEVIKLKQMSLNGVADDDLVTEVARLNGFDLTLKKLLKCNLKSYFRTINEIETQFKDIANKERMLSTNTDSKLINAGIDNLEQFGDLNTIDALANGDILKWELVLELEWFDVFNKLLKNKVETDIRNNLDKK